MNNNTSKEIFLHNFCNRNTRIMTSNFALQDVFQLPLTIKLKLPCLITISCARHILFI